MKNEPTPGDLKVAGVKHIILALLLVITGGIMSAHLWPYPQGEAVRISPVLRHPDELVYAVRVKAMWKHPSVVAVPPVHGFEKPWYANPFPSWSSWPFLRVVELLRPENAVQLVDDVRFVCRLGLLVVGMLLARECLRGLNIPDPKASACGILLGGYLAFDPGLAHLKPLISILAGKGNNGCFVGFDRLVSPSSDIVFFALAWWSTVRLVRSLQRSALELILHGLILSILLLIPPWYLITYAITVLWMGAIGWLQNPRPIRDLWRHMAPGCKWLLLGALPALGCVILKTHALIQLDVLDAFMARVRLDPTRQPNWLVFTRTWTMMVGVLIAFLGVIKWRKEWLPLGLLPVLWIPIAVCCFNSQVVLGRDVCGVHFEFSLGLSLGVAIIVTVVSCFSKRLFMASCALFLASCVSLFLVSKKSEHQLQIAMQQRHDFGEIASETLELARNVVRTTGLSHAFYVAPDMLTIPIQYFSDWTPLTSPYMAISSYRDEEIWEAYLQRGHLMSEKAENIFPKHDPGGITTSTFNDEHTWPYGLPPGFQPPKKWTPAKQTEYLSLLQEVARHKLAEPFAYSGPFPLVVVRKAKAPSENKMDPPPERIIRVGIYEALIWNQPFQSLGRPR